MSAYGVLSRSARSTGSYLPATTWRHPRTTVTLFHLDLSAITDPDSAHGSGPDAGRHPGLFDYLHAVFADEVDKGLTYPQEDMHDPEAFKAYFFAADVIVAIVGAHWNGDGDGDGQEVEVDLEHVRAGRPWDACVAGFYYVKPNYPGRSSHVHWRWHRPLHMPQSRRARWEICNAGFVVPPSQRNSGYGRILARSYLYYAPRLGYHASVFNLVYVNNTASIRIWESLGFVKAGLIPGAGRLRRTDGPGEEYVDAWVFYKRFDDVRQADEPVTVRSRP